MPDRRIATVLMLDVVGSTHVAAELGDARYRELSRRFDQLVRSSLKRFGGREEDHAGDGFFATFPQPDRAILCASSISDAVRELGIEIRCGVHTGQTESLGGKTQGIAVVIGARVMSLAGAGEILVTSTTKELVTGSGFRFEDFSAHELKGVPGPWQVFAATAVDGAERPGPLPAAEAAQRRAAIEPSPEQRRPGRAVLVGGAACLVAIVAIVAINFADIDDESASPPGTRDQGLPSGGVVEVDPDRPAPILRTIPLPTERHGGGVSLISGPHPIVVDGSGVWSIRWQSLFHVDPARSEVRERVTTEAGLSFSTNLAAGLDEIWLAFDGGLLEVDPATHEQRRVITLGSKANPVSSSADVVVGGGFVWLGLGDGRLIRFDPRTERDVTKAGFDPIDGIAFGHGAVWTVDAFAGTVTAYDPETMRPRPVINVGSADGLVVGDSGVWVVALGAGTLTRIDPSTGEPGAGVQVGSSPAGLVAGSGAIWVGDEDGVIRRVDEGTRQVAEIMVGGEIRGLAHDDETGTLWVDVT